jgi:UDP-N-acetylmuramoyl-L-alanyl-D-glutamate--2,6-diaminopimelate ligase
MAKALVDLLATIPDNQIIATHGDLTTMISAPIVESSLDVAQGGIFVARKGLSTDGHQYIDNAVKAGASAIVGEIVRDDLLIPYIQVKDAQEILGLLAAAYYDFPSRKLVVIGITGTDGKTTTSHILHSILKQADGIRAGFISTISADFGDEVADTGFHVTTPSAPQVQAYLARMVDAGLTHCILEMTSHGLAQGRLNGVDIDVAVLTNIMHEHLDFHGSWENYRDAKAIMFRMLGTSYRKDGVPKIAVVNADDKSYDYFKAISTDKVVNYGVQSEASYLATDIQYQPNKTSFVVQNTSIEMQLVGEFNISNTLAGISVARELHVDWRVIQDGIASIDIISGRMERIDEGQNFVAIVDFAHTPNALKRALEAGRTMLPDGKQLICVFGSAGLRDVEKRRMMADTSALLADMTILTAEDPRTESLDDILEMMAQGCISQGGIDGETFIRIRDRGEAIYQACQIAQAGDIVMACGKGHEQSMCFGLVEHLWDDRDAMRSALRGKPLATLPTATGEY